MKDQAKGIKHVFFEFFLESHKNLLHRKLISPLARTNNKSEQTWFGHATPVHIHDNFVKKRTRHVAHPTWHSKFSSRIYFR